MGKPRQHGGPILASKRDAHSHMITTHKRGSQLLQNEEAIGVAEGRDPGQEQRGPDLLACQV